MASECSKLSVEDIIKARQDVIADFYANKNDNSSPAIAKRVGISVQRVNKYLNKHFKK